jgi:glycosyltransferase involved in cell wall biosynthesis
MVRRTGVRLLHSPHFNFPFVAGVPRVITIHDLAQLHFPGSGIGGFLRESYARAFITRGTRSANAIITDSQFIRDEVRTRYGISDSRIFTIPLAVDLPVGRVAGDVRDFELPDRFFLYVGTNKPWKNLKIALMGLALASQSDPQVHLVIAGKQARNQEPLEDLLRRCGTGVAVTCIGTVSDLQLATLYEQAVALLCPSVYEGFGLTALEGMSAGTPVIHSGAASLGEVVESVGIRADPYDAAAWSRAALSLWRDGHLRARLGRQGRARAAEFTIDRMTAKTVEVYRRVIGDT